MPTARRYRGRVYSSPTTLLGLPLLEIQTRSMHERQEATDPEESQPRVARGWIAIGDIAHGRLLAMGGMARGFIAVGGLSRGFFSFGGCAIGVFAFGGAAIGLFAFGGLAVAAVAIGGGAIGWWACGGGALAADTAIGGGAIAYNAAQGGGALAKNFAIGATAIADHANDAAAHAVLDQHPLRYVMDWTMSHQLMINSAIGAVVTLCVMLIMSVSYERTDELVDSFNGQIDEQSSI